MTDQPMNLDCMTEEELRTTATNLRLMADYATHKADAMRHRGRGRISLAEHDEAWCERIFNMLPDGWRW